jgi:formylglycine-generating enzyme required for sulfatase activity
MLLLLLAASVSAAPGDEAEVPGGVFRTALPASSDRDVVAVATFRLDRLPVTNADFATFVAAFPEWRRDRAPQLFADTAYLRHWATPQAPDQRIAERPVTHVSWFAAGAYCEAQGKRLPSWHEWELAAAASETRTDAREDADWRQRILGSHTTGEAPPVGSTSANVHGIGDLHGGVWEWVEDFNGMLISADGREQGDPDLMRFCAAGAVEMQQKEHYAILMRIAMLSSLEGNHTTSALGFRCARDAEPGR